MTREQRKEEIFKLIREYIELSDEDIDFDAIIEQACGMVDSKFES